MPARPIAPDQEARQVGADPHEEEGQHRSHRQPALDVMQHIMAELMAEDQQSFIRRGALNGVVPHHYAP